MKADHLKYILITLLVLSLPSISFGLSELSAKDLKASTAQAGISIAVNSVIVESWVNDLTISNPQDATSYVTFEEIHSLNTLSAGTSDINGDGLVEPITFDVFTVSDTSSPVDGQTFMYLKAMDLDMNTDTYISGIDFAGTEIGSASIIGYSMPSFEAYIGAHSSGFDIEFSHALNIDSISYNFSKKISNKDDVDDPLNTFKASGIHLYGSFTGAPDAPSTWVGSGMFKMGDIFNGNAMTIDFVADNTEYWVIERDPIDGGNYAIPNPRNGAGFVAINGNVQGSLRVENISSGGTDMGPLAIDGINLTTFNVEFPGRGLGDR